VTSIHVVRYRLFLLSVASLIQNAVCAIPSCTTRPFLSRLSNDDFEQGMTPLRALGDVIDQNEAVTEEID